MEAGEPALDCPESGKPGVPCMSDIGGGEAELIVAMLMVNDRNRKKPIQEENESGEKRKA
jgi:hypothetical protein